MDIHLKYNIGDTMWFMFNNRTTSGKIEDWTIEGNNGKCPTILYKIRHNSGYNSFYPGLLYTSKEKLLKSL